MSFFSRLSLANRGLTALVAVIVTAFGLMVIPQLKQQLFPSLDFPAAFVSAAYPGAAPEVVAGQVTEPIENALQGTPGLKRVTSTSSEGVSTVQIEFEFGTDLDDATTKMQSSLNRLSATLPDGVDPQVFAFSTDNFPVVLLSASNGGDERQLAEKITKDVLPAIQGIDGVREAQLTGERQAQLVIAPNPAKLAGAGLTVADLMSVLKVNGIAMPAGTLPAGDKTLTVSVGTPLTKIDDLKNLYLRPSSAAPGTVVVPVKLGDVATITEQLAPATSITRTNGKESLGIMVFAAPDGNAVGISHEISDMLPDLKTKLGGDAQLTAVFDQAPYVEKSIEGLTTEGALGLVMAIIVILVFLLSIRSTIVTAVSIPLSVIIALIALKVGDYSLNILTLGALTIAIGRVVDDSIVVLENIKRHLAYGEDKQHAVLGAVKEVAGAVTASTLTTVAVFSPIALVGGLVGQLFSSFAITVTVALLASLAVSLTIIPVLAYWFLKPANGSADGEAIREAAEAKERRSFLQRAYVPIIRFATRRRWLTVTAAILVFFLTMGMASLLKTNFLDQSGETTLTVSQEMPKGTSLAVTDAAAKKIESVVANTEGVETYQVTVGSGGTFGFGAGGGNSSTVSITLKKDAKAYDVQAKLRDELAKLTDVGEVKVDAGNGGGGFSASTLQIIVQADDDAALKTASDQVRQAMSEVPDVTDVASDLSTSAPRVQVTVDRQKAAAVGLTEAQVAQAVGAVFRGAPLGQYTLDGRQQQVVLTFGAASPTSLDQLKKLPIAGPLTLDQVAEVATVDGPTQITRIDGDRSVTVSGTATGSNLGKTTQDLNTKLKALQLPAGATYTVGGASADQADAFGNLGLALLAAIAIVFLIMAATFKSLVQPLILLVSVPFAATGAILALLVTDTALGVPALIGMLMLIGIVVTNAIVLLDLVNQYRAQGAGVVDAVVEGGRRRLRPILMTAVATIFALLPMALGITGEGGFISQPLAVVVIGGLISSTVLTLILVPTLYTMVEGRKERKAAKRARKAGLPAETPAEPEPTPGPNLLETPAQKNGFSDLPSEDWARP
ncbi:MAG: efflux RND transporter permease subunit [Hamadaea sp.]|nr:efflux RND transporter permease subunit [Hamadaea sp.]NUR51524.1 efflux RND transporter permease subunit [Hamadaea sp.]